MRRVVCLAVLAAAGLSLPGCAPHARPNQPAGERHSARLITRVDIKRSGATDGWDALKRAGNFMSMKEGRGVGNLRTTQRGRSSILLSDEMMLVVDDVVQSDLSALRQIPAQSIDWMKVLSGTEATYLYGTPGAGGVIIVRTGIAQEL